MRTYPQVPLGEICAINPRRKEPGSFSGDTIVSFVPMAAVNEQLGTFAVREDRPLSQVSKGFSRFANGDILFARISPCMENGKAALVRDLTNGIGRGSSEFFVLRPGNRLLAEYVYHLIRQPYFREAAKNNFTGTAGQQRVPKSFLENAPVPLPPIDEQRRIANILNRGTRIEQLRIHANALLRHVRLANFIKMFGDPLTNPMRWETRALGNLGSLARGRSRHRPRNAPELYGGNHPFIQTGDVSVSDGMISTYSQTYSELGLAQSRMWPAGTLCITIAANIAMTGILAFDACFPDSIVGFTPNKLVTTEFVQTNLDLMQRHIEEHAPGAAQRNINLRVLEKLKIPLPPYSFQIQYAEMVAATRKIAAFSLTATGAASSLGASLFCQLLGSSSTPTFCTSKYALDNT